MPLHLEELPALPRMITVERCRRILGNQISHLNDDEVAALCRSYELLADIAIENSLRILSDSHACNEPQRSDIK